MGVAVMIRTLVACIAVMALASGFPTGARAAPADTLKIALAADIRSSQPGFSPDDSTNIVLTHVVEGLVAPGEDGTPRLMLADHVDVTEDGRSYIFTLRRVLFHNGAPLTAQDVVWTWRRYLDPSGNWPGRAYFDGSRDVQVLAVDALDTTHVRFTLAQPVAEFLSMMARPDCGQTAILSPASVNPDGSWREPVGTGPYKFGAWKKGEYIDLVRFPRYAARTEKVDGYAGDKTSYVEHLHFVIIPDPVSIKNALETGDIDVWHSVNPEYLKRLQGDKSLNVTFTGGLGPNLLLMQTEDPLLRDPRLRHAIAMAIDTRTISKVENLGLVPANNSLIPAGSLFHGAVESNVCVPFDPEGAKRLLREAGYHGQPIVLFTTPQYKPMYDTALIIEAMGQAAGINIQVEALEFSTMLHAFFQGKYQLMIFFAAANLDPTFTYDRFIGDKEKDRAKVWDDPQARALVTRLMHVSDRVERQALFDQVHMLFIQDLPMLPMHTGLNISAASTRVLGYFAWPGSRPRFWGVRLAPGRQEEAR